MSELSKNKKLKKLYDYGDRITPQKWAKAIDMLSPYSPPEDAPVIDTTYKEAKAIYEAGEMKTGVYYQFEYEYYRSAPIYDEEIDFNASIPLKLYLDDTGHLKAKGYYKDFFVADYTFECPFIVNLWNEFDGSAGYDVEYFKTRVVNINDDAEDAIPSESFTEFINILKEHHIEHYIENKGGYNYVTIPNSIVNSWYDYENDYCARVAIVTPNGLCIEYGWFNIMQDGDSFRVRNTSSRLEPGYLYNLNYGDYSHSHIILGRTSFKGNIDIRISNDIIIDHTNQTIYGYIKDSTIYMIDEGYREGDGEADSNGFCSINSRIYDGSNSTYINFYHNSEEE